MTMSEACVFITLLFCVAFSLSSAVDGEDKMVQKKHLKEVPMIFPNKSSPFIPIVKGDNPDDRKLPPKVFPAESPTLSVSGPPILNGTAEDIVEIKNNKKFGNETYKGVESSKVDTEMLPGEQDDMIHGKYTGGHDVDEIWKSVEKKPSEKEDKKASEKDEKKPFVSKKDPKSEVDVHSNFDKKGPKMMNETNIKQGDSVLGSTSKMMAMSSSVLSNTQAKHDGFIKPIKTAATVLLSVVVVVCLGFVGFLIWKRIAMRRFGRDVLINEDDFDEVSDMHTFEHAQIQIT